MRTAWCKGNCLPDPKVNLGMRQRVLHVMFSPILYTGIIYMLLWVQCSSASSILTEGQPSAELGGDTVFTCKYLQEGTTSFGSISWRFASGANPDGKLLLKYPCPSAQPGCENVRSSEDVAISSDSKHSLTVNDNTDRVVANLTIQDLQLVDEGNYTCTVRTSDGPMESAEFLSVNVYPRALIIRDPTTNQTYENGMFTADDGVLTSLTCSTDRAVKPKVGMTWISHLTDGRLGVTDENRYGTTPEVDDTLQFSSAEIFFRPRKRDDGRELICQTSVGDVTLSTSVRLQVKACPSTVSLSGCTSGMAGTSLNLTCESDAAPASETSGINFYLNGQSITLEGISSAPVTPGGAAQDHAISRVMYERILYSSDHGSEITCCIEEGITCPERCSHPCQIEVFSPPSRPLITKTFPDEGVMEGTEGVNLTCSADGEPKPRGFIRWTKDGFPVTNGTQSSFDHGVLVLALPRIRMEHAGIYSCIAENEYAIKSRRQNLVVLFAPEFITKKNQVISIDEGEQLTISCTAVANPAASMRWLGNNNESITWGISSESEVFEDIFKKTVAGTLTVLAVDGRRDYGTVSCVAENDVGESRIDIHITGRRRPDQPVIVSASASEQPDSLTIHWTLGYKGGASQTSVVTYCLYPDGLPCDEVTGIEGDEFILTGLQPGTWYSITVAGENRLGRGNVSEPVVVRTQVGKSDGGLELTKMVAIATGGVVIVALFIGFLWTLNRRKRSRYNPVTHSLGSSTRKLPKVPLENGSENSTSPFSAHKIEEQGDPTYADIIEMLELRDETTYIPMNKVVCSTELPGIMTCNDKEYRDDTYNVEQNSRTEGLYTVPSKRDTRKEPRYVNNLSQKTGDWSNMAKNNNGFDKATTTC